MNIEVSLDMILWKLNSSSMLFRWICHCWPACFKPYKAFFSRHTWFSFPLTTNPFGCSIYISSLRTPFRYADLMSMWWTSRSKCAAIASSRHKESRHATSVKVSLSSTPSVCENPLATRQAWSHFSSPRVSCFVRNTHLCLIGVWPFGRSTSTQVLLSLRHFSSSLIAASHQGPSGVEIACSYVFGSLVGVTWIVAK